MDDLPRLEKMLAHANLVIGAYRDGRLVGIARALTDFSFCCYLSDLAVAKESQNSGIGRELIRRVKERVGDQSMLLLLSAPEAMGYYPKAGSRKSKTAGSSSARSERCAAPTRPRCIQSAHAAGRT